MDRHTLANTFLAVTVKADGAEPCSLRDADGREYLWQAGPAWPRHAPVLFPIVGRLKDDRLIHDGRAYRLTQHGFARDRRFTWIDRSIDTCRLRLDDDVDSRALFPFPFHFEVGYALSANSVTITYAVTNPGSTALPVSIGAHPAFCWPLADGIAKTAHRLEFPVSEPAPIRRLAGGLLKPDRFPTPIRDRILPLDDTLFAADALILDQPASRKVRFTAPNAPSIEVEWTGFVQLGLWSKPGADFLCIEPWHGMASPVDFDGEFAEKPGLLILPPNGHREMSFKISVQPR
jgi:galactose mutarotase-like enzyme